METGVMIHLDTMKSFSYQKIPLFFRRGSAGLRRDTCKIKQTVKTPPKIKMTVMNAECFKFKISPSEERLQND